jgi:hypothetical protein
MPNQKTKEIAIYHPCDDLFDQAIQEIWSDPNFSDKQEAIAALREAQAEANLPAPTDHPVHSSTPEGAALLKLRIPDHDYAPEAVAQIAATLVRNHTSEDHELAVAQAYRLLDVTHRISDRHKLERVAGESEELIPFGEAMKQITGTDRPGKAAERLIGQMIARGSAYIDYEEVKRASGSSSYIDPDGLKQFIGSEVPKGHNPDVRAEFKVRKPTKKEIEAALAPFRENGFSQQHVARLRAQFVEIGDRVHTENLKKKPLTQK